MKYNKLLSMMLMVGSVTMFNLSNAAALTDSTTINFTGVFQDTTCKVDINSTDVTGNKSIDLYLGAYTTTELTADGQTTTPVPFSVGFSNCGSINTASITFSGTQTTSKLFDVQGANKATVAVGVNSSSTASNYIAIGDKNVVTLQDGSGTADFYARYVKVGSNAIAEGEANSVAVMNITYL